MKPLQKITTLAAAAALLAGGAPLPAADHLVPSTELRQQVRAAEGERAASVERLQELFSSDEAEETLRAGGMDAAEVSAAVASLDDDSLAKLAARAAQFESDVEAGALNNQQITYILIALATAVIILAIVAA